MALFDFDIEPAKKVVAEETKTPVKKNEQYLMMNCST